MTATVIPFPEDEVQRLSDLYEGLQDGTRHWWEVDPSFTCADKTGAAIDQVWQELCEAERNLAARQGGNR